MVTSQIDSALRGAAPDSGRELTLAGVEAAIARSHAYFRQAQSPEGYWQGVLESNPTMEAEYILLSYFLDRVEREQWRKLTRHILAQQRADGSWGQYFEAPGDVSTSIECYFALKLAGFSADAEPMQRARQFILRRGGVPQARVFTKIWLALFGQWDWRGAPNMPPELMLLPAWFPFNIYEFASWARGVIVPMLLILTRHPVKPIPEGAGIEELYPQPPSQTDFRLPTPQEGLGWARLLYQADRLVGLYQRLPIHPLRKLAERKAVNWILEHQEADGSWGGIQPPWVYSLIALHDYGLPGDHPALARGFQGFKGFAVEDAERCMIQSCISPVWDTCLAQIALLESGMSPQDPITRRAAQWLVSKQVTTGGDWQVKAKGVEPGGWPFEFHNNNYPDIDDAAEVMLALAASRLHPDAEPERQAALRRGVNWLLALQSENGGWGSFDKDSTRYYLTKLPFCDFGETLDPPSADVTAHVVELLGNLKFPRSFKPLRRAYAYLRSEQEEDGSWFGRWGVNYIYGTGAALPALAAIGEDMSQPYIRQAVAWLLERQNSDGGWGEKCASYVDPAWRGRGPSTPSQTAWALLALLAAGEANHPATRRGVEHLLETQNADGTWDERHYTGTGFPGYGIGERMRRLPQPGERGYQGHELSAGFMISYRMYRNYWPLLALGRYRRLSQ